MVWVKNLKQGCAQVHMIPIAEKIRIIRLARSGSLERANSLLEAVAQRTHAYDDPAYLTIKGRLTKDRAKRAQGDEASQLFAASADLYEKAQRKGAASYPLINAASMALLSGDRDRAQRLAAGILAILETDPSDAETPYWLWATRAEAYLLTGRRDAAHNALEQAMGLAPDAREDHAATVGQLEHICGQLGYETHWLDPYRPPATVSFAMSFAARNETAEHTSEAISKALDSCAIGYAFGSLQTPSDVRIADEIIGRGIDLHLVLACDRSTHIDLIDRRFGEEWGQRCAAIVELCEATIVGSSEAPELSLAPAAVVGAALQNANMLQSKALHLGSDNSVQDALQLSPTSSLLSTQLLPERGVTILTKHDNEEETEQACHAEDLHSGLLKALEYRSKGMAVAIDFSAEGRTPNRRLSAIAEVVEAGNLYCSIEFAYCALATCEDCPIQHIGDIRSAIGSFPLFAIA